MTVPDPVDVVDALTDGDTATATAVLTVIARAYTRGRGFTGLVANDEIAAVIATAATRLAANGSQLLRRDKVDDVEREFRSAFQGWTLTERIVLDRYRVKAL